MKKVMKFYSIIIVLFVAVSCSSNKWSCPLPESGKSCRSISAADNDSEFSLEQMVSKKKKKIQKNILSDTIKGVKIDDLEPVRTKEVIGKILITPYVDEHGNLNSGKFIYTIDAKPSWQFN